MSGNLIGELFELNEWFRKAIIKMKKIYYN